MTPTDPSPGSQDPRRAQGNQSGESPEHRALASLGLLGFLDSAIGHDEYADAQKSAKPAKRPLWRLIAIVAITSLALVAASQTASNSSADGQQRTDLIRQIKQRKASIDVLTSSINSSEAQINALQTGLGGNQQLSTSVRDQLALWGTQAGVSMVSGPGVEVVVNDAPANVGAKGVIQDRDLQQLANGLWESGAEAISINGQRITGVTAIRTAGSAITVNYQSLTPPYVIDAIGDPATIPATFAQTDSGAAWLDLQQQLGMVFSMTTKSALTLGAAILPILRYAQAAASVRTGEGTAR